MGRVRRNNNGHRTTPLENSDPQELGAEGNEPTDSDAERTSDVEKHRQCPICWPRFNGAGKAYCTRGRTRYYKCGHCGHTWTAIVEVEVHRVEHREVELDER